MYARSTTHFVTAGSASRAFVSPVPSISFSTVVTRRAPAFRHRLFRKYAHLHSGASVFVIPHVFTRNARPEASWYPHQERLLYVRNRTRFCGISIELAKMTMIYVDREIGDAGFTSLFCVIDLFLLYYL